MRERGQLAHMPERFTVTIVLPSAQTVTFHTDRPFQESADSRGGPYDTVVATLPDLPAAQPVLSCDSGMVVTDDNAVVVTDSPAAPPQATLIVSSQRGPVTAMVCPTMSVVVPPGHGPGDRINVAHWGAMGAGRNSVCITVPEGHHEGMTFEIARRTPDVPVGQIIGGSCWFLSYMFHTGLMRHIWQRQVLLRQGFQLQRQRQCQSHASKWEGPEQKRTRRRTSSWS